MNGILTWSYRDPKLEADHVKIPDSEKAISCNRVKKTGKTIVELLR